MTDEFRCCGRPRVDGPHTFREYGTLRCRICRRKYVARASRAWRARKREQLATL